MNTYTPFTNNNYNVILQFYPLKKEKIADIPNSRKHYENLDLENVIIEISNNKESCKRYNTMQWKFHRATTSYSLLTEYSIQKC